MTDKEKLVKQWNDRCSKELVGKTIKEVRYLHDYEVENLGWSRSVLVIIFNDDSYIFPSMDDEGNDGGALFTSFKKLETIPVIHNY